MKRGFLCDNEILRLLTSTRAPSAGLEARLYGGQDAHRYLLTPIGFAPFAPLRGFDSWFAQQKAPQRVVAGLETKTVA
jgi:hypothetical protein